MNFNNNSITWHPQIICSHSRSGRLLSFFSIVPRDSILDISNAFIGFIYYAIVLSLEQTMAVSSLGSHRLWLIFTLIINCLAMSVSIYLAIKLIYLREICILCWTTHVLNFLLLRNYWRVSRRISFKKNL
jgi:uncharacterized membrane protein